MRHAEAAVVCSPLMLPAALESVGDVVNSLPLGSLALISASGGLLCIEPVAVVPSCAGDGYQLKTPIGTSIIRYSYSTKYATFSYQNSATTANVVNHRFGQYSHRLLSDGGTIASTPYPVPHEADYLYHGAGLDSTPQSHLFEVFVVVDFNSYVVAAHVFCES